MDTATVNIQAEVANMAFDTDSLHIRTVIRSPGGKIVHDSTRAHCFNRRQKIKEYQADSLVIVNPARWDCDNPNLYTAELTLYRSDGSVADRATSRFGIRKLEYSPESGLRLNGRKVLLKGIANHHTLGALGAAAYPAAMEKRIRLFP